MYLCFASMQIRPSSVSNTLMSSAVTGQMAQRLQELNLEILGRDNLILLIQKLNLYPKERARYSVEDVAEETFRKNVHIQQYDSNGGATGAQAFRIVFTYPDKDVARRLVVEVVSQFQSKNISVQQESASKTSTLFDDLVKNAREKMEQKEVELATFTSENQGKLPENSQSNTLEVQTRQANITNIYQRISAEKQRQSLLESNLNNNKNSQSQAEANLSVAINTPNQQVKNQNLINIESDISRKQQECVAVERKYQPAYPDVLACHDQVKLLEDRKADLERTEPAAAQTGGTTRMVTNSDAAHQLATLKSEENNIRAQINASVLQAGTLEKDLVEQTRELKEVQDKISSSPQVNQKFSQLNGELQMAKDEYQSLSTKRESAGTQVSVEEHSAGERLDVLEQPITPEKPTSPIRGAIVGAGTVIGFFLGVVLAGAKEVKNTTLKNLKDVRAYTNLPVLSSIPLLENALLVRRKRRLAWLAWSSALIVGTILMSGAMYYHYVILPQM
jgi:uncharacterized protein involved in exopolysaccharide biosynthesis